MVNAYVLVTLFTTVLSAFASTSFAAPTDCAVSGLRHSCFTTDVGGVPSLLGRSRTVRSGFNRTTNRYGAHYFLGTSAIPIDQGTGWYKNTMVSFNSATYCLTEHLSFGAGIDLVSLVSSRSNGPLWTTRLQLSGSVSDVVHLGAVATYLRVPLPRASADGADLEPSTGFGAGLAMITIGNADNQLTLAGGLPYDGSTYSYGPLLFIAGAARFFPNVALITEHWILSDPNGSFAMHSFGARVIGQHLAIDLGLAYDELYAIKVTPIGTPFVSATLNF